MMLDEPTRGVDVGAKAEIYRLLFDTAERGIGILVSSSEIPELLTLCDRILVMFRGRIVASLSREEATEARIAHFAGGHHDSTVTDQPRRRRPRRSSARRASGRPANRYAVVLVLLLGLFVYFSVVPEQLLHARNIENLLTSVSILWVVSMGMTFVVLTAGIDLSVGSLLALSGSSSRSCSTTSGCRPGSRSSARS